MIEEIINTCYATTIASRPIAYYSHLIPVILSVLLAALIFVKSKHNLFSKIFLSFISVFSLWLIGDVIIWTQNDYFLAYASWAPLDYIEVVFYMLGLYFALVFVKRSDISIFSKTALFLLTLPPFILTVTRQSVIGFNYPVCEAFNNDFSGNYKLIVEGIMLVIILFYVIVPFLKKSSWKEKRADLVVLGSMFLFLSIFGVTEYLASTTGYYEMNLYSLFLLPVFLIAIIYSVFELDIFNFHILGTHYLVVGIIVFTGWQLFFITNTTEKLLTILTIVLAIGLSIILFKNLKRESDQREQIAKLNISLQNLIEQRESLVHLITHKVKGSFTRSKYIFAELLAGTFGPVSAKVKNIVEQGLASDNEGIKTVDLVLNAASLQTGKVKFDMKPLDFKKIVEEIIEDKKGPAKAKGLKLENKIKEGNYIVSGDGIWLKEAVRSLIDNGIKYTLKGGVTVGLEKQNDKILFSVKDTGVGITDEDKKNLFKEGGRGKDSVRINVDSTGYGLFTVKMIVEAHRGRAWAESVAGKGSIFYAELPLTQK